MKRNDEYSNRGHFSTSTWFTTIEEEKPWFSYEDGQGQEVRVFGTERYDHVGQIKHETAVRRWYNAGGEVVATRQAPLALLYIFPQEMEALLYYNGFNVLNCYGDWDLGPLTEESRTMVYLCEKREKNAIGNRGYK